MWIKILWHHIKFGELLIEIRCEKDNFLLKIWVFSRNESLKGCYTFEDQSVMWRI